MFAGETTELAAAAVGYPVPTYQWLHNTMPIPGATNAILTLVSVAATDGGTYEVQAVNSQGTASASAEITVRLMPDVRITEVQSTPSESTGVPTADWWELTNFELQPVDLSGWRFNDAEGGLDDAFTLPQGLHLEPGQSLILVENLDPAEFRVWWGLSQVPASVPIVSYSGTGLGLSANGDGVRVWNDTVIDPSRTAAAVDFGQATVGVSFNYDPVDAMFGELSRLGVHGVFQAVAGSDLGSPGRILAPPVPPQLSIVALADGSIRIGTVVEAGRFYFLERRESLDSDIWQPATDALLATNSMDFIWQFELAPPDRYFRLRVE